MFEKIKGLFEIFSQSSLKHKDKTLRTVTVKMGASYLASKIIDILKSLKYKTIKYNEHYQEIFTSKAGFEVTNHLVNSNNGSTLIDVDVYSPNNRGKTRKALRFLLNKFKEEFKQSVVYE